MTHLNKTGLKKTKLVKALQKNIGERPGFTLAPASTEMNKMKANRQRDREIHSKANWLQPGKAKTASETERMFTHTFRIFWTFKATTWSVSLWLLWFLKGNILWVNTYI